MRTLFLFIAFAMLGALNSGAQSNSIRGRIVHEDHGIGYASLYITSLHLGCKTDSNGYFTLSNIPNGIHQISISAVGYTKAKQKINLPESANTFLLISLTKNEHLMKEVVISGTLKEVNRSESAVPVEVYSPAYFKKNPSSNLLEAIQMVNGVRPQLNCNICNTGDIHINGLEGPYTMVLIDGMPIVSALSTVYGLSGIPNSLVERIEIVKGPASSLYGSEAVGGVINVITKRPERAPALSLDVYGTTYGELNVDAGVKWQRKNAWSNLFGVNYFRFQNPTDQNQDGFTDVTLQHRISLFNKISFKRKENKPFRLAGRYYYEDRWGGEMRWTPAFRGGDSIYGESIYTSRFELLGQYELPFSKHMNVSFSFNSHQQNSVYGTTRFNANQKIGFGQITYAKKMGKHDILSGAAIRYTFYDDNTPATFSANKQQNQAQRTFLPGIFIQDEIQLQNKLNTLIGFRLDHHPIHGIIYTPRLALKKELSALSSIRLNAGTGFRVVNIFTEDHAALSGARDVMVDENLNPEKSYNLNFNILKTIPSGKQNIINLDASLFYTYFNNRIVADYETDPQKIFYDNLNGFAHSYGFCLNMHYDWHKHLKLYSGITLMENKLVEDGVSKQQLLTEKLNAVWTISYTYPKWHTTIDYTGNVYSPMRLPLASSLDPRKEYSPWFTTQHLQITFNGIHHVEVYGGIKNLWNWTPAKQSPFLIARANDPFDKQVQRDANGTIVPSLENPYGLSFDPGYVYAPNQGRRFFVGLRYAIKE